MKKLLSAFLLAVLLSIGFSLPARADSAGSRPKTWRITLGGHILQTGTDSLLIYLKSPQNMAVTAEDRKSAGKFIPLPVTEVTVLEDSAGNPVKPVDILPGQEVRAEFRCTVSRNERGFPDYNVTECLKVSLAGETIKRKSAAAMGELEPDTMLGTFLSADDSYIRVFVDGGRIVSKEYGIEFMARGVLDFDTGDATITDTYGNKVKPVSLKPFQRVLITGKDHYYGDGSLGYCGSKFAQIQLLKDGEKILPASDIESFRKMTATVLRHQQNEYGEQQLDIRPDDGRRELTLQPEYVITQSNSATAPPLWSFKPGTRIGFSYEGLNYSGFPGKIEEYYQLKAVD